MGEYPIPERVIEAAALTYHGAEEGWPLESMTYIKIERELFQKALQAALSEWGATVIYRTSEKSRRFVTPWEPMEEPDGD